MSGGGRRSSSPNAWSERTSVGQEVGARSTRGAMSGRGLAVRALDRLARKSYQVLMTILDAAAEGCASRPCHGCTSQLELSGTRHVAHHVVARSIAGPTPLIRTADLRDQKSKSEIEPGPSRRPYPWHLFELQPQRLAIVCRTNSRPLFRTNHA